MVNKSVFINILMVFLVSASITTLEFQKSYAPNAGDPVNRNFSVRLKLNLNSTIRKGKLDDNNYYKFWTYDDSVPGPFIRTRVGDILDVALSNYGNIRHGVDFHAAIGPGGGEHLLQTPPNTTRSALFKLTAPGLYFYHCGTPPVPMHLANGLYGLLLVEPLVSMAPVQKEFYIMRSEFYTESSDGNLLYPSEQNGMNEAPQYVVFNGHTKAMIDNPLKAKTNDWVRIYVGNAGPNQIASFHIIGIIFNKVYREGDLLSSPSLNIQTTLIPAGGSAVVEFQVLIPGNYTIVDHSIFRINKGAIGLLTIEGPPRPDLYCSITDKICLSDDKNEAQAQPDPAKS